MDEAAPFVRPATPEDAAEIAALQVRSWKVAYRGIVPDTFLDDLAEDAWLERWITQLTATVRPGIHRLVSTDGHDGPPRAVALCGPAMAPVDGLTGQLYVLYTDPPFWGQGHGGALMSTIDDMLAADGHAGAMLWVAAGNDPSIAFYEHHGWSRDGATQREEVAGAMFDEIRMVRRLAPAT